MTTKTLWLAYLVGAYAVLPVVFRLRFGRWPYAYPFPRPDLYTLVDFSYGAVLWVYAAALFLATSGEPVSAGLGVAVTLAGGGLQGWAVSAMGSNWRFGLERDLTTVHFVTHGPFRFLRHPVYLSLVLIAGGQVLLVGPTWYTLLLTAATVVHFVLQARAETRHWTRHGSNRG